MTAINVNVHLTADIVSAHASNNDVTAAELPILIQTVYDALAGLGTIVKTEVIDPIRPPAAASIRKSLADPEHLISMIDGKPYRALKRHLSTHGYTPDSYRRAFGLPASYPMTSKAFATVRRDLTIAMHAGKKAGKATAKVVSKAEPKIGKAAKASTKAVEEAVAPKRRSRLPKSLGDALKAAKGHLGGNM